jgi:hypothetical protein
MLATRRPGARTLSNTVEIARYRVELRWHTPRRWGGKRVPHGGRFYAYTFIESRTRRLWSYAEATGVIGPGGVETTELAILRSDDDPEVPDLQPGQPFELSRGALKGMGVAAEGRVIARCADSN